MPRLLLRQAMGNALVGRAMHITVPSSQQLQPSEAGQRCSVAMAEVAEVQQQAHVDTTVKARQRVAAQFQQWLAKLPDSHGASLLTAGPEHVLWFTQEEFTKKNTGGGPLPDLPGLVCAHLVRVWVVRWLTLTVSLLLVPVQALSCPLGRRWQHLAV